MTERTPHITPSRTDNTFRKLSIQVGLNGLSFGVLDTLTHTVLDFESIPLTPPATPTLLLKELKAVLAQKQIVESAFSEVTVIHKNKLFSLVPQTLFSPEALPNYLKFNAKIATDDYIAYDEIPHQELVNVYVPYANVNNYLFDCFGAFEYKHSGTVLLTTLFHHSSSPEPVCYVHVAERVLEMAVFSEKKLRFYNQFTYTTPEDFLYYLLFSLEQAQVALEKVQLQLLGRIAKNNALYKVCHRYVKNVTMMAPGPSTFPQEAKDKRELDFIILSHL